MRASFPTWADCGEGVRQGRIAGLEYAPDYGTGFVFSASRCFFVVLESLVEELARRSTWKMHGQDVSNDVTVALWKGVITLNNAHAFT